MIKGKKYERLSRQYAPTLDKPGDGVHTETNGLKTT